MVVREAVVIEPQLVQDRGVQVGYADPTLDGPIAHLVRRAVHVPLLESATRQQQGSGVMIVVAPASALRYRQPSELTGPKDNRTVQQTAPLQILDHSGRGQIGGRRDLVTSFETGVRVPAQFGGWKDLYEADTGFDQLAGQEATPAVQSRPVNTGK